ncbi:MAG: hypothetical protein ACXWW8_03875 [Solirubrobacterales bacterium]
MQLSRRERLAAWYYTGPLGRLVAFLLDLAALWVAAVAHLGSALWRRRARRD